MGPAKPAYNFVVVVGVDFAAGDVIVVGRRGSARPAARPTPTSR